MVVPAHIYRGTIFNLSSTSPEAKFLDKIQTKVLRVSPLQFAVNSTLCLEIYISSNSHSLLQFLQFKHTETSSMRTLKIMPRNLNEIVRS